jgi:EpsI family protein
MIRRILLLSAVLLLGVALVATASRTETVPARESLAGFPLTIGEWRGLDEPEFSPDILAVLGVDEYINRVYRTSAGRVGLYVGFYGTQRQGDTIHSPMNCLPGAGWEPTSKASLEIPVASRGASDRTITVNRYVIEKGLDRHVVLYWYQSHGRVIANEYQSKILMVLDAVRLNRTDAALVRVISPGIGPGGMAEDAASDLTVDFVKKTFPILEKYLPS